MTDDPAPLLEVEGLDVWFTAESGTPDHVVRDLSFDVMAGERVGLIGESGCGKTTTLFAVLGLLPPSAYVAGSIRFRGEELLTRGEDGFHLHRWRHIALVMQSAMNSLDPVQRIGSQIGDAVGRSERAPRDVPGRVGSLLELVGIPADRRTAYPHQLSGGMRQRAAIAMALAGDPQLLLADEPTTALDVMVQAQITDLLVDLSERLGIALVLVTHDLGVVADTCERGIVMYAGRVIETGSVAQLSTQPRHPYTRQLYRATPMIGDTSLEVVPFVAVPTPVDGCAYRPRCDMAIDVCAERTPELATRTAGHASACHRSDEVTI